MRLPSRIVCVQVRATPNSELAPYACTSSMVDLPPLVEVVLFVIVEIGGWFEFLSC